MKRNLLIYSLLIIATWSCTQENDPVEKLVPKPAGKYLSEIRSNIIPLHELDSTKIITFEYDQNRFLKRVNFLSDDNEQVSRYSELFYNSDGLLDHINAHFSANHVMIVEKFTYENRKLVLVEGYKIENNKSTLVGKTTYKVDAENNVIEFHPFDLIGEELVEREAYQKYYFNSTGNLTKYHYNIGQGGFFETMEDFEYDNRISPFASFELPYYNILSVYFYPAEYFSRNNVVRHKDYHYENGTSYEKAVYDTIIYKYDGQYPTESAAYCCFPDSPLELKSRYFFKYVDLK